jgi:hypothetical protein
LRLDVNGCDERIEAWVARGVGRAEEIRIGDADRPVVDPDDPAAVLEELLGEHLGCDAPTVSFHFTEVQSGELREAGNRARHLSRLAWRAARECQQQIAPAECFGFVGYLLQFALAPRYLP